MLHSQTLPCLRELIDKTVKSGTIITEEYLQLIVKMAQPLCDKFEACYPQIHQEFKNLDGIGFLPLASYYTGISSGYAFMTDRNGVLHGDLREYLMQHFHIKCMDDIDDACFSTNPRLLDQRTFIEAHFANLAKVAFDLITMKYGVADGEDPLYISCEVCFLYGVIFGIRHYVPVEIRNNIIFLALVADNKQPGPTDNFNDFCYRIKRIEMLEEEMKQSAQSKDGKITNSITLQRAECMGPDGKMHTYTNVYAYPKVPITIAREYLRSHQEKVLNTPESIAEGQHPVLLIYQQELRDYLEAQTEYTADDLCDAFAYYWLTGDVEFFQRFCAADLRLHQERPEILLHCGGIKYCHMVFFNPRFSWHRQHKMDYKVFMGFDQNNSESRYILCRLGMGSEAFRVEIKDGKIKEIFQRNNFRAERGYYDNYSANFTEFIDSEALEGEE